MAASIINADERFSNLFDSYKLALRGNVNLRFAEFCREHEVNFNTFRHWLERKGISLLKARQEAARELFPGRFVGVEERSGKRPDDVYPAIWEDFKRALSADRSLTLARFCRDRKVKCTRMQKWMSRNCLTVLDLRVDLGIGAEAGNFSEGAKKRFRQVVGEYKSLLADRPNLSFEQHCRNCSTDHVLIRRWMRHAGISVTMLKESARRRAGMQGHSGQVGIRFRPNGSSASGKLRSVMIQLPDGTLLSMEECTVVELCSFVVAYNDAAAMQK